MKIISMHGDWYNVLWEDFSDNYAKGLRNKSNSIVRYQGFSEVWALVTSRGNVLASKGMSCNELQYLISNGYVK